MPTDDILPFPAPPSLPSAEAAKDLPHVLFLSNLNSVELHAGVRDYNLNHGGLIDNSSLRYPGHLPPVANIAGILASLTVPSNLDWVIARNCPVVHMLETHLDLPGNWPRVVRDLEEVGRMGARHLLELGNIDLAFYRYFDSPDFTDCRNGFVWEIEDHGRTAHEIGPCRAYEEGTQLTGTRAERVAWLKSKLIGMPRPLAIMADDDLYALDVVHAARELGLRIPEDIAILGMDDQPLLLDLVPEPISSIDVNFYEIGRLSCELLHRMLQGAKPGSDEVPMLTKIPPKRVVMRNSTATFQCDHPGVTAAAIFIRQHSHEAISVRDVADHAKISLRSLQLNYPQRVGRTVKDDIQAERLKRAQRILETTDIKLAAVAVESGFGTIENLCRVFQANHQTTPSAWRTRYRHV